MMLIPDWRQAWRMFSVRVAALAVAWSALPVETQAAALGAIGACKDIVQQLDCYTDADTATQRTILRRLNEAIGVALPRLAHEKPGGQALYGLRWIEQAEEIHRLRMRVAELEARGQA